MRSSLRSVAAVLGWALCSCASLPQPLPEDVLRGRERYATLDLAQLTNGRKSYVRNCGGCHALYLPRRHTPEQWAQVIAKMEQEQELGLSAAERQELEKFLVTLSLRPEGSSP